MHVCASEATGRHKRSGQKYGEKVLSGVIRYQVVSFLILDIVGSDLGDLTKT